MPLNRDSFRLGRSLDFDDYARSEPVFYPAAEFLGWFDFAENVVGCGVLVAMASICLIQYFLHMYYVFKTQQTTRLFEDEIHHLTTERQGLEQGHRLTELENRILRDFVSSSNPRKAGELLLKHFAPNPARSFAALLFIDGNRLRIEQTHGLSKASRNDLDLQLDQLGRLVPGEARILQDRELRQSEVWNKLHYVDRRKAQEIIFLPLAKAEEVFGLLMTTSLSGPSGTRQDQLALALRLMTSLSGNFQQQIHMKRREHEIRQTEELLQLRSLTDASYDGPLEMVEAFLQAMLSMLDADSITLYLPGSSERGQWKPMVRCSGDLPASCLPQWERHESRLLNNYEWESELKSYDRDDLERMGIDALLRTALMVPLPQEGRIAGVFCISRQGNQGFTPPQRQLANWSAQHLGKTLTKLQSIADIKLQAKQDGLTALANRRTFDEQLERELRVAQRASVDCSLLLCDLDRFKSINDTYGHPAGDEVLRIVARILNEKSSQTPACERALTARYGGEEMAVILPGQSEDVALQVAEEIRRAVAEEEIWWQKVPIEVTISIGVACFPANAVTAQKLIASADQALYRAKTEGRNRVCLAGPLPQAAMAH